MSLLYYDMFTPISFRSMCTMSKNCVYINMWDLSKVQESPCYLFKKSLILTDLKPYKWPHNWGTSFKYDRSPWKAWESTILCTQHWALPCSLEDSLISEENCVNDRFERQIDELVFQLLWGLQHRSLLLSMVM